MKTTNDFLSRYPVQLRSFKIPDRPADDWPDGTTHYACILLRDGRHMAIYFSQGSAHRKSPCCQHVIDCLAIEAASVENSRDFSDWCGEFGYSKDSRKAHKIYKTCHRQAKQLKRLLGEEAYAILLFETERL